MKYLKKYRDEILIFSLFILLSLLVTHPLIFKMRSHIYASPGDPYSALWMFWWLKYARINHISFLFCPLIATPFGVSFAQFVKYPFWETLYPLLSIPFGEVFTYNLVVLLSFSLSAITTYFLVLYFTKNKPASMVSGILYAFCPFHFAHAAQHIGLANIQWIPLYLLTLFKLTENRTYKNGFFVALAFSLCLALSDYYLAYFAVVSTLLFIFYGMGYVWRRRGCRLQIAGLRSGLKTFKVILATILIASVIVLPLVYSTLKLILTSVQALSPSEYIRPLRDLFSNSARPLGYLLPSQSNPFFGNYTRGFVKTHFYGAHLTEHTLYLGWVGIVLSIVAIREWRRRNREQRAESRERRAERETLYSKLQAQSSNLQDQGSRIQQGVGFFLLYGLAALLLSRSPYIVIGGFKILFPSYFMYKIAPMFRVYARFGILVMLSVAVLAGIGLANILNRITTPKKRRIFLVLIGLLVVLEFAPSLPAPMIDATIPPPVYQWIAEQPGDFAIAEYPLEDYIGSSDCLFYQRMHKKRLINGALPGSHADKVRKSVTNILDPKTPGVLNYLGAKYVIFHPERHLRSEDVEIIGAVPDISKQKGLRLIKDFEEARVYKIVAEPIEPTIED